MQCIKITDRNQRDSTDLAEIAYIWYIMKFYCQLWSGWKNYKKAFQYFFDNKVEYWEEFLMWGKKKALEVVYLMLEAKFLKV